MLQNFVGNSVIPSVLMASPYGIIDSTPNNKWMEDLKKDGKFIPNIKKIEKQFFELQKTISSVASIYAIPAEKGLQDLAYVANLGMIFPHLNPNEDRRVLVSNFKSEPRKGETKVGYEYFKKLGFDPIIMPDVNEKGEPMYFEGEADLKWLYGNVYVGADGNRTNGAALDWIAKTFNCEIIKFPSIDEYLYHLDCNIFPLGPDTEACLVNTYNLDKDIIKELEKHVEVIPLGVDSHDDPDQYDFALAGTTNSVLLPGGIVITPSDISELNKKSDKDLYEMEKDKIEFMDEICSELGLQLVVQNISGYYVSGASLSCNVMHLNQRSYLN